MLVQSFLRDLDEPYAAGSGSAGQSLSEQYALRFMHSEMHGKNLTDAPIRHRLRYKHSARRDVMVSLLCA